MAARSFTLQALVLKRRNIGETDRLVTLLSQEKGRFVCIAKGVRKLNSSKRAFMEPGNIIQAHFVRTKSLPLLIQAKLISSSAAAKTNLSKIRQLSQILEIFDKVFVEEEQPLDLYKLTLEIRQKIIDQQTQGVRQQLGELMVKLGFVHPQKTRFETVLEYVQSLVDRPMKSFDYLNVEST